MFFHGRPLRRLAPALLLSVAACSDGNGGASTSSTPTSPPTSGGMSITFAVAPTHIAQGQSARLSWSTRNAQSCSAGGDWSGDEPTASGDTPFAVTPEAIGTHDYFLSCTDSQGNTQELAAPLLVTTSADLDTRIQAAADTAASTDQNSVCGKLRTSALPDTSDNGFYWEIGDKDGIIQSSSGARAAGSVQSPLVPASTVYYQRNTQMLIASASKWLYGAYAVDKLAVQTDSGGYRVPDQYVPYLNFTSGYDLMSESCPVDQTPTVADCLAYSNGDLVNPQPNGTQNPDDAGHFYYNSGHLEHLEGVVLGGGDHGVDDIAGEITGALSARGIEMNVSYISPNIAGGGQSTAQDYAQFLQALVSGADNPLVMDALLQPTATDPYAVCTNPDDSSCGTALFSPLPDISWHYSLTHWIEDDQPGDGSYSSPGAFGFYPWIDPSKTYYGILARMDANPALDPAQAPYYQSVACGQAIRKAFITGVVQD